MAIATTERIVGTTSIDATSSLVFIFSEIIHEVIIVKRKYVVIAAVPQLYPGNILNSIWLSEVITMGARDSRNRRATPSPR